MLFIQVSWLIVCVFTAVHSRSEFLKEFRQYFPADLSNAAEDPSNVAAKGSDPYYAAYRIGMAYVSQEDRYYFLQQGPSGRQDLLAAIPADVSFDEATQEISISPFAPIPLLQEDGSDYDADAAAKVSAAALEYCNKEKVFFWLNAASPEVLVNLPSGKFSNELQVPDYHKAEFDQHGIQTKGIPEDRGYHAAALVRQEGGASRLDVMAMAPLIQDSAAPSVRTRRTQNPEAAPVRIIQFGVNEYAKRVPVSEFIYMMGPLPKGFDEIFVEDLVSLGEDEALVLETYRDNSDKANPRFMSQVFRIQYNPPEPAPMATDVFREESIAGRVVVDENAEIPEDPVYPVRKELVFRIDDALLGDDGRVDQLSYMAFGPELKKGGGRLLYIGSDNENQPNPRAFQLLAFRFDEMA